MPKKKEKLSSFTSNVSNPRYIKEDKFKKLCKSVKGFPEMMSFRPMIVDEDGVVLAGNMRHKALVHLGYTEIPGEWVKVAKGLTPEQKKQIIIKDNVGFGEWDWDMLANEWNTEELEEWGLDFPFEEEEKETVIEGVDDEFQINENTKTDVVLGDLIEIGPHRFLCGDSTDSDNIEKLLQGEFVDFVFTDPPYNMHTHGGSNQLVGKAANKMGDKIEHLCNFEPKDFLNSLHLVFPDKKMNAYIFCNKQLVPDYLNHAVDLKYNFNILFWKKPNAIPLGSQHRPDVEYLIAYRQSATWNDGLEGVNYSKCLEHGRENSTPHPTMKPIELITNQLLISSKKGHLICDFFLGSGSTMVAAHQTKRRCVGFEHDPFYCQIIINRMLKQDPKLSVKINGEEYKPKDAVKEESGF